MIFLFSKFGLIRSTSVEVSGLHAGDSGKLELTGEVTIPGYVCHEENNDDIRTHTVTSKLSLIRLFRSNCTSDNREFFLH